MRVGLPFAGNTSLGLQPAFTQHALQSRVERAFFDLQQVVRDLLDVLDECVAVHRLQPERVENHHFKRAGEEVAALRVPDHAQHYICKIAILKIGMLRKTGSSQGINCIAGSSGEASLTAQPESAVEQAGDEYDDQHEQPDVIHRDLRHAGLEAQPQEDCDGGGDDGVVPPTAALARVEFATCLRSNDGAVVEAVAVALALDGEVA